MSFEMRLETILERYDELSALLSSEMDGAEIVKLSKEQSQLEDIVAVGRLWKKTQKDMQEAEALMHDSSADADMKALASEEYYALKEKETNIKSHM